MRLLMLTVLLGGSLLGAMPAQAADNDYLGQAQRFLNPGNDDQERAYERGRRDEDQRNRQAERNRQRYNNSGYRDEERRRLDDQHYYNDRRY